MLQRHQSSVPRSSQISRALLALVAFAIALLVGACGDDGAPAVDSSTPADSSVGDSAPAGDSSSPVDGSSDATLDGSVADGASDGSVADAAIDAATDAAGDATVRVACTANEDCRAFSDYCDGCTCLALLVSEADPVCTGTTVTCFIDPCELMGAVRCNRGTGTCEFGPRP